MSSASNEEIRRSLVALGVNCGPVTDSTRSVYLKKLDRLRAQGPDGQTTVTSAAKPRRARAAKGGGGAQQAKKSPRAPSRTESDEESQSPPASIGRNVLRKPVAPAAPKAATPRVQPQASPRKAGRPAAASYIRHPPAIAFDYSDADHGTGDDEDGEEYSVADASANTSFAMGSGSVLTRATQPSPLRARPPIGSSFGASQIDPYRRPLASSTPTDPYRRRSPPPLAAAYAPAPRYAPPRYGSTTAGAYVPAAASHAYQADRRYAVARQADQSVIGRVGAQVESWRAGLVAAVKRQAGADKPAGGYQAARASYRPYSAQNRQRWPERYNSYTKGIAWHYAGKLLLAAVGAVFAVYFLAASRQQVAAAAVIVAGAAVDTVDVVYRRMILPILAVLILAATVAGLYYWRKRSIEAMLRHRKAVFDMVEHITRVLREHSLTAMGRDDPYLPVAHIRDMIIKPADRSARQQVWQAAVRYTNECESRVSTETKLVHGRESMVWRWLDNHNASGGGASVSTAHGDGAESNVSDDDQLASVGGRPAAAADKVWQGHALSGESDSTAPAYASANGGSSVVGRSNAPSAAPSRCLKLRGLFDSRSESGQSDWPQHISDALLERIGDEARVYHVAVDKSSSEGVVYARLADLRGALNAFRLLNGSWFAGKMVRAKFVRDERYSQRFPESAQASLPLTPSKPRHSLAPSAATGFRY